MKTPRELLLERHRAQSAALDRLRKGVIATEFPKATAASSPDDLIRLCASALRRVLGQHPMAWSSLAAAWAVILGLNLSARFEGESPVASVTRAEAREVLEGMRAYRAQLAALLTDQTPRTGSGVQVRPSIPGPRSDADHIRKDALHFNTAFA